MKLMHLLLASGNMEVCNIAFAFFAMNSLDACGSSHAIVSLHFMPVSIDAHHWIGGDVDLQAGPDPIFFVLHGNVDRIWSIWQDNNIDKGGDDEDNYGNPGYPEDFMGPLFNFPEVTADEMFDYPSLGYCYDNVEECDCD